MCQELERGYLANDFQLFVVPGCNPKCGFPPKTLALTVGCTNPRCLVSFPYNAFRSNAQLLIQGTILSTMIMFVRLVSVSFSVCLLHLNQIESSMSF
jgi:hypothetical protein